MQQINKAECERLNPQHISYLTGFLIPEHLPCSRGLVLLYIYLSCYNNTKSWRWVLSAVCGSTLCCLVLRKTAAGPGHTLTFILSNGNMNIETFPESLLRCFCLHRSTKLSNSKNHNSPNVCSFSLCWQLFPRSFSVSSHNITDNPACNLTPALNKLGWALSLFFSTFCPWC